jgi:two-component system, OmpR family, response regulator
MRVLVVEDEVRLARALQKGLRAEGFVVDLVHDGAAGLSSAREGSYDAIVLDVMLPRLSGYEVVRTLRTERNWVPVLMLSAKDGEYDQADGLDLGADDYVTKPFSFVVFVARVRALVRRGARPRPPVVEVGRLRLDPATRVLTSAGAPIDLTTRELAMLEYLMRNIDRVVTKEELLAHVWPNSDTDVNAVEVYAGYLRRKLGRDILQTVRGSGYRLTPS